MPTPPEPSPAALPTLDTGPHLLDATDVRGAVHALVCDRLLTTDGPVWWVDAGGTAVATSLADLVPSRRVLDRINVARGFTAYQHHTIARRLRGAIDAHVREGTPAPSLVVSPAVDDRDRADDVPRGAASRLLASAVDHATTVGARHRCPVLFTRSVADSFSRPVADACDRHLRCRTTRTGPRLEEVDAEGQPIDDGFETLTCDVGDGWLQTTFACWRAVFERRQAAYEATDAGADPREVLAGGAH
jgi:hypothetical protein